MSKSETTGSSKEGVLIRSDIVAELISQGYSRRKATEIVNTIIRAMMVALRRGERVVTPIGSFQARRRVKNSIFEVNSGNNRKRVRRFLSLNPLLVRYKPSETEIVLNYEKKTDVVGPDGVHSGDR